MVQYDATIRPPQYRKMLMAGAGALYILFGILAFFGLLGGHDDHHHTPGHNLTHILLGTVALILAFNYRPSTRKGLCFGFAAGYFLISLIGAIAGHLSTLPIIPGFIEFHAGDYVVHFVTGSVFLALGLVRRSDTVATTSI